MRNIFPIIFIITCAIFFFFNKEFKKPFTAKDIQKLYENSQWVNPTSKTPIGDSDLYVYAGVKYLSGFDPSLLNPEMPPLGKILIGFIASTTGYKNISGLLFGFGVLAVLALVAFEILGSVFLTITILVFFSLEKIFLEQVTTTLLDLPQLFFLLLSIYFFLKSRTKPVYFLISAVFAGAVMATKLFIVGVLYLILLLGMGLLNKIPKKILLTGVLFAVSFYILCYFGYFINGHTFRDFLGLHKWIVVFYQQSLVRVYWGAPIFMLIFNRWETWWSGTWFGEHQVVTASAFNLFWPAVTFVCSVIFFNAIKRMNIFFKKKSAILTLWVVAYLLFLFNSPIWPRYLLLIIPLMYILALEFLIKERKLFAAMNKIKSYWQKKANKKFVLFLVINTAVFVLVFYFLSGGLDARFNFFMGRDWHTAYKIYLYKNLVNDAEIIWWPFYVFLGGIFLIFNGNVFGLWLGIFTVCLLTGLIFILFFSRFKYFFPLIIFGMLGLFNIKYHFLNFQNELRFSEKIAIVEKELKDNKIGELGILAKYNTLEDESYLFLFKWLGVENRISLKDIASQKPKVIYLIFTGDNKKELNRLLSLYDNYGRLVYQKSVSPDTLIIRRDL